MLNQIIKPQRCDVLILGAGAAGMMCAIGAGARGRKVMILDHAKAPGEKIRISGGGRCNFTNLHSSPKNFISENPHFAISALKRYTQHDFIAMVERHKIAYHEKTLGQLFCDNSAKDIINMLLSEMKAQGVKLHLMARIGAVRKIEGGFEVETSNGLVICESLVIATGGKSIPKMGATGIGYEIAKQFGLNIIETRAGLVPLTASPQDLEKLTPLAGVAFPSIVSCRKTSFAEASLITHRGLSGPAMLQISSYWREGDTIHCNLAPDQEPRQWLENERKARPKIVPLTALSELLPKRLAGFIIEECGIRAERLADLKKEEMAALITALKDYTFEPSGTEGYRTAEVTLGGVDTRDLDQKTMEAKTVSGLYFIGEVVDVTGHLGGHNFQWAWSSGHVASQTV